MNDNDLAPQRHARLREIVRQHRVVRIGQLSRELGVSIATVRRDLDELDGQGSVRRVHGGAVSVESRLEEPLFDDKASIAAREKRRIAEAALKYIQPNETIFLDGGSTVLELARLVRERSDITIVTNSLRAAVELAARGPGLIFIGGEVRRLSQVVVGPLTRLILEHLHFDKAFLGTIGICVAEGLTTTDPDEAYTKEFAMLRARQVFLLADSSKAGKISFARAGRLQDLHVFITDKKLETRFAKQIEKLGIEVVQV
jgi:DeoR family fructose operon transcriptional repressor